MIQDSVFYGVRKDCTAAFFRDLHSTEQQFVTDVQGQPIGPICNGPLFLCAKYSHANYIPSKVPLDTRVELLETYWKKDDDLGTRFLCLAGTEIIYKDTTIKNVINTSSYK